MRPYIKKAIAFTLKKESQLVLWKYKPKIIAVTGSLGKTSTKDAIYAALSKVAHVRKSEKSFNSELGLPLTILGLPNAWNNPWGWIENFLRGLWLFIARHKYPKWLVLEVGISKPGDMRRTASWLETDAVVLTTISEMPVHIEFFESRKHLVEEKSGLIKTLKKDGFLVLNADDETVLDMKNLTKSRVITYGFKEGADVRGSGDSISCNDKGEPEGVIFRVDENGKSWPVVIKGVFGRNHVYASLAALALASGLKMNMLAAAEALKNYDIPPGRMRLLKGINNSLIIDDTYNSSPFACESALKTLGKIKCGGRKIAVLGDMLELGKYTVEAHKNVGKLAKENVDVLVVVGPRAKGIKEGALEAGLPALPNGREQAGMNEENIFEFLDSHKTGEFLKTFVQSGDLILIKGSQGMRMERAVEEILLDQTNKEKLLVRQDAEWKKRK